MKQLKSTLKQFLSWKGLISFSIAWFITNGHAYLLGALGLYFNWGWAKWYGGVYLGILYLPFTPEKLLTFPLAYLTHRILWRENLKENKDERTN